MAFDFDTTIFQTEFTKYGNDYTLQFIPPSSATFPASPVYVDFPNSAIYTELKFSSENTAYQRIGIKKSASLEFNININAFTGDYVDVLEYIYAGGIVNPTLTGITDNLPNRWVLYRNDVKIFDGFQLITGDFARINVTNQKGIEEKTFEVVAGDAISGIFNNMKLNYYLGTIIVNDAKLIVNTAIDLTTTYESYQKAIAYVSQTNNAQAKTVPFQEFEFTTWGSFISYFNDYYLRYTGNLLFRKTVSATTNYLSGDILEQWEFYKYKDPNTYSHNDLSTAINNDDLALLCNRYSYDDDVQKSVYSILDDLFTNSPRSDFHNLLLNFLTYLDVDLHPATGEDVQFVVRDVKYPVENYPLSAVGLQYKFTTNEISDNFISTRGIGNSAFSKVNFKDTGVNDNDNKTLVSDATILAQPSIEENLLIDNYVTNIDSTKENSEEPLQNNEHLANGTVFGVYYKNNANKLNNFFYFVNSKGIIDNFAIAHGVHYVCKYNGTLYGTAQNPPNLYDEKLGIGDQVKIYKYLENKQNNCGVAMAWLNRINELYSIDNKKHMLKCEVKINGIIEQFETLDFVNKPVTVPIGTIIDSACGYCDFGFINKIESIDFNNDIAKVEIMLIMKASDYGMAI